MFIHIDSGDRGFAHSDAGSAIAGNEAAEKLEKIGIVADDENVLTVSVFSQKLLEIREGRIEVERGAYLDFAFITKLVPDKLCCLQRALQWAGNDDVRLNLQRPQNSPHNHALFFALSNKTALRVSLRALTRNSSIGMAHQV